MWVFLTILVLIFFSKLCLFIFSVLKYDFECYFAKCMKWLVSRNGGRCTSTAAFAYSFLSALWSRGGAVNFWVGVPFRDDLCYLSVLLVPLIRKRYCGKKDSRKVTFYYKWLGVNRGLIAFRPALTLKHVKTVVQHSWEVIFFFSIHCDSCFVSEWCTYYPP